MYKCSFCGKEYESAVERARCEISCEEKVRVESEKKKKAEIEAIKQEDLKAIKTAIKELKEQLDKYNKKYGTAHSIATSISLTDEHRLQWDDILEMFRYM